MASLLSMLPSVRDFFPPTPQAFTTLSRAFKILYAVVSCDTPDYSCASTVMAVDGASFEMMSVPSGPPLLLFLKSNTTNINQSGLALWTPARDRQFMGKTSIVSQLNLPGRWAWATAEVIGPLNLIFVLYTLPSRLEGLPPATGIFGTGLPIQNEIMGLLYVIHYANRAIISPVLLAPSLSPIHVYVAASMALFQFMNSALIGSWLCYSAANGQVMMPLLSLGSIIGITAFTGGLAGNIIAETSLYDFRRGAARRKAKSEGRATITYDKVYVIPPPQGLFKYVLFPHYSLEWVEWTGYYILGGAWGLGFGYGVSAALWFLINELMTMAPRASTGLEWYTNKFGVKAVGKRKAVLPGIL